MIRIFGLVITTEENLSESKQQSFMEGYDRGQASMSRHLANFLVMAGYSSDKANRIQQAYNKIWSRIVGNKNR